jgi:spoIIIJ-associated protein
MRRRLESVGKTVEAAVESALQQLGVGRERAEVTVLTAPARGLFGIGSRAARVEVAVIDDPAGDVERFLRELFVLMDTAVHVVVRCSDQELVVDLDTEDPGLLIGRHGQTLDALQALVTAVAHRGGGRGLQCTVDAQGYRERKRQLLVEMASKMADKAVAQRREIRLPAMPAHERKVVHLALEARAGITTESRGQEPDRAVMIIPDGVRRRSETGRTPREQSS